MHCSQIRRVFAENPFASNVRLFFFCSLLHWYGIYQFRWDVAIPRQHFNHGQGRNAFFAQVKLQTLVAQSMVLSGSLGCNRFGWASENELNRIKVADSSSTVSISVFKLIIEHIDDIHTIFCQWIFKYFFLSLLSWQRFRSQELWALYIFCTILVNHQCGTKAAPNHRTSMDI